MQMCRPKWGVRRPRLFSAATAPWTSIYNNLAAIRRALEDAGVEFIPAKSGKGVSCAPGVSKRW